LRWVIMFLLLGLPQIGWKGEGKIPLPPPEADHAVDSIGREYYEAKFEFSPSYATSKGVRDFDSDLATFAPQRVAAFSRKIGRLHDALHTFCEDSLSLGPWVDFQALSADMATQLFLLDDLQLWRRSPLVYCDQCVSGIYYLVIRPDSTGSQAELESRLSAIPEVVAQARRNLSDPISLHCEIASRRIKDFLPFLDGIRTSSRGTSPKAADQSVEQAQKTLAGFAAFLDSLAPTADQDFALGREDFTRLLEVRHLIHDSPEDLIAYAEQVLGDARRRKEEYAGQRPSAAVDTSGVRDLTAESVRRYFEAEAESARVFVERKHLVTLPAGGKLEVVETPLFLRSLVPGYAYEPPGPFDADQKGLFYVPLPGEMTYDEKLRYKSYMERRSFAGAVVHEAYPGHHVQIVTANSQPSFIRRLQDDVFTVEGWAFYCEELMAASGYGGSESMARALDGVIYRAARVIVDVRLQLGDFSLDDAVDFMVNETGAPRDFVEGEVRRYAVEPGQAMSYLIGKREIESMRDDARRTMGDSFTLRDFHDSVLSCGSVPLYLLRTCVRAKTMDGL
jgi:hypothetical protein